MKVFLMHRDRDFDLKQKLPSNEQALTQDLELNTLFNAMALGDEFLMEVAKNAVFAGLNNDPGTIVYRQHILQDCLKNPALVRSIYDIAGETREIQKKHYWGISGRYPGSILFGSVGLLQDFAGLLKKLKKIAAEQAGKFASEGFKTFFEMIERELADDYFASVQDHLRELKFRGGVLMSAELGKGNEGANYILRKPKDKQQGWLERIFARKEFLYSFCIDSRDDNGITMLSQLKDRGINLVANAVAQSADHILSFFTLLRIELAFYVGCLNLHGQLAQLGEPASFPVPEGHGERRHSFKELYDICLALTMKQKVVGNDVHADDKNLVIITGANQGGKSTFLRSIGLAQLMMQCGMFAPAKSFRANVCDGLFTHYKREEDVTMKSGKLDEELSRMSDIIANITSNPLLLFNESFAATNEREGAEISRQIVSALLEKGFKIFFVTHSYKFAHDFYDGQMPDSIFLRAERQADGARTFKLIEGEPLQTSFGEDLYNLIFSVENKTSSEVT